jgi:cytochrome oxidase Cu insertion factor (SCO1/SenC/PrrC family)
MMSRTQKTISVCLWILVVIGLALLMLRERDNRSAVAAPTTTVAVEIDPRTGRAVDVSSRQLPDQFAAPDFSLTDHRGMPFSDRQLRGKVWTAMLFFSECTGVCPMMTGRITELQNVLTDDRIQFLSFTVDPANDTVDRLAAYAKSANAQPRWHLLTGTDADMKSVALGFKIPYDQPANHSSKILLVDQAGRVRGIYESREVAEMKRLVVDANSLLSDTPAD